MSESHPGTIVTLKTDRASIIGAGLVISAAAEAGVTDGPATTGAANKGKGPMRDFRLRAVAACVVAFALWGCGKEQPAPGASDKALATVAPKVAEEKVPPYTYPSPVKGHYSEINIGKFDVVDGIAYTASGGAGTVVYVTDKPIASPVIAESGCPMTKARALSQLRDARYMEVTLLHGSSKYFAAGTSFGGSSREQEVGGHYWSSRMKDDPDRAVGSVVHKHDGHFTFDLPISHPGIKEVSESDRSQGMRSDTTAPRPTEQAVTAAYNSLREAALKKDLKALLVEQGFDAKQSAAIRGLDGIDADLAVYADRFLAPGTPGEFTARPGTGYVRAEGTNSKGKKFTNFYHFNPCGSHLVLVSIAENPQ